MKRAGIVLTLTLLLVAMALHANATPQLRLGLVNALQGQTAILNLSLAGGEEAYAGINAKILLPEGVTITGISEGEAIPANFTIDWHGGYDEGVNWVTVIAYSGTDTFSDISGSLLEFGIQVATDAAVGTKTIQIENSGISNEDGSVSVPHTTQNGSITCLNPANDSDGDGFSDGDEVRAGTNPLNKNDIPAIYADISNTTGIEDGSEDRPFATITASIVAAPEYYTILVAPGTYDEVLMINKNINLVGASPTSTVIDAGGGVDAISFDVSSEYMCNIQGFTIRNADSGINCANGAVSIRNNVITQILDTGIKCEAQSTAKIINNTIVNNHLATGLESSSTDLTVVNNIISGNGIGIDFNGVNLRIDYNNIFNNTNGNYIGCDAGIHDMSNDLSFIDAETGDFRLASGSNCIDAGDPMEKLTTDYTGGSHIVVDEVTNIEIGDRVWITDGNNTETDEVVDTSETSVEIQGQFVNSYLITDGSHIYTDTSKPYKEPEPDKYIIDIGAYGNTAEAGSFNSDLSHDGDVDGSDLAQFVALYAAGDTLADVNEDGVVNSNDLARFAANFGRNDCPIIPGPAIGSWTNTTSLPQPMGTSWGGGKQLIIYYNKVYVFGGQNDDDMTLVDVYYSAINIDGSLGPWLETTPLPGEYFDKVVVRVRDYVYLITGASGAVDVFYAPIYFRGPIYPEGWLGDWVQTSSLYPSRQGFAAVAQGDYIYVSGGNAGGTRDFVKFASVNPDGSLNPWADTTPLPEVMESHTMAAHGEYLYAFAPNSAAYYAHLNSDGTVGNWSPTTALPQPLSLYSTFAHKGYLYLLGGNSQSVYYAKILNDGSLGSWQLTSSFAAQRMASWTGAYGGFVYATGGYDGSDYLDTVLYAPFKSE